MASEATVVKLASTGRPDGARLVRPESLHSLSRNTFGGLKPSTLHRILRQAERGELEDWADLVEYMVTTDTHVRSVYETRLMAVAGATWQIEPGRGAPGSEAVASAAAEVLAEEMERHPDVQKLFGDLLHAVPLGWSALEHVWYAQGGRWRSAPQWIHPRDIRLARDYTFEIRTHAESGPDRWIRVADMPGKFIVHAPRPVNAAPTKAGEFMAFAYLWVEKRWTEKYRQAGMERFATPHIFGILPEGAADGARDNLFDGLERLSYDHIAAFEQGTSVQIIEPERDPGEACNNVIQAINGEISKSYLGSGLNVEVQETGGNRSLGESQFDTTILPRLQGDARRLANTVEHDWFKPFLEYNRHLFGGVVPPVPKLTFQLVSDDPDPVSELSVVVGAATVDEVRRGERREPWGQERGGNRIAVPLAKTVPNISTSSEPAPGGAGQRPFSRRRLTAGRDPRQLTLPLGNGRTSKPSRTTALRAALEG